MSIAIHILRRPFCACVLLLASGAVAGQAAPPLREGDIAVDDGVQIHYVEDGDPKSGTTILFVPGWCTSSAVWREAISAFSPTTRVVAIDPRSQGRSTITLRSNTPEQRAQDLHRVIQSLALRNVVLVGWSQGVQDVAAYAAAFAGDAIAGYVLVDAAVGAGAADSLAHPEALQQLLERLVIYEEHPREYLRGMLNAIIRSAEGRKRIDEFVEIGSRTPPDLGIGMLVMDFVAYDRRPALAKFNRPTLVVAATESADIDAQREMSRRIKDARFVAIEDAGHALFLDQPGRFHAVLADFLREATPRPSTSTSRPSTLKIASRTSA